MTNLENAVAIYIAYLIGSISSAILVCRIMSLPDPRQQGSKNPGATNVLRIGGKKAAMITLLGDMLKAFLPVLTAQLLGFSPLVVALIAFAAFLGHLFPIFFNFEGGKGVATALGAWLALSWPAAGCWVLTWVLVARIFRYSSLAAITASLLMPGYMALFKADLAVILLSSFMSLLLLIRHRKNIAQLLAGTESKIGGSARS